MESTTGIGRYRKAMRQLVSGLVGATAETERWLGVADDRDEWRAVLEEDSTGAFRIACALLLRKARVHATAVVRADETCNVHSLGVQMRPALECAGQVVLLFRNLVLEPEGGGAKVLGYLDADYYKTTIKATRGEVGHDRLLEAIASARREADEHAGQTTAGDAQTGDEGEPQRSWKFRQIDKVAELAGGEGWYRYLSEHFCHGEPDGERHSWHGGVNSANTVRDELTCAGMMDYLANQLAVAIAYAALCPRDGKVTGNRADSALALLGKVRAKAREVRDFVLSRTLDAGAGGSAG